MSALTGKLLVASPMMPDDNFSRTVVLVLEHGSDGTAGVILNRPTSTSAVEALTAPELPYAQPALLFVGGPVQPQAAICIGHASLAPQHGWQPIVGPVGVVALSEDMPVGDLDLARVYAGFAGWSPGQLESEIAGGGWFVVDSHPQDILTAEPEALWDEVLRRQNSMVAAMALYPDDLSLN